MLILCVSFSSFLVYNKFMFAGIHYKNGSKLEAKILLYTMGKIVGSLIRLISGKTWPGIIWTLLILVACTWPGKDIPAAPVMGFDKLVHSGLFTAWAILWLLAYPQKNRTIVLAGMAYGLGLEFYQQLLPFDRTFDWWDAVADAVGVLIGYGISTLLLNYDRQRLY